ncbi:hypothetical protein CDL60_08935 [Roseateles noduli]|nr:hypothetical protein CDL60_08935 [Roseateles noduli]
MNGFVTGWTELDELKEIARLATRRALELYEPIPAHWNDRLALGTLFDGDDRVFELYVPAAHPADATVISRARVNRLTKEVSVFITNLTLRVTPE